MIARTIVQEFHLDILLQVLTIMVIFGGGITVFFANVRGTKAAAMQRALDDALHEIELYKGRAERIEAEAVQFRDQVNQLKGQVEQLTQTNNELRGLVMMHTVPEALVNALSKNAEFIVSTLRAEIRRAPDVAPERPST